MTSPAPSSSADRAGSPALLRPPGAIILLAIAVLAAYANTFSVPFLLDDTASVTENASIRRLWPPGAVLAPPPDAGVGGRPISNLSFALNYAAGGLEVRGYHAFNLAVHLGAGLLLFGLVRRTLGLPTLLPRFTPDRAHFIAFGTAALWLLHPLQTETVTYVSQRTEGLMAFFYLGTLYAFVRGLEERPARWSAVAVAACAAGMATKEVMVTAPVLVFLFDRTFVAGTFRAAWERRRALHLSLAGTWIIVLFLLAGVHERGVGYAAVSAGEYALTSCRSIVHYLRLAIWPAPLVFDHGSDVARSLVQVWPQVLAVVGLVAGTAVALRRSPRLGFLPAWVLLLLAPTTSVVPVAGQPFAEHRLYLPLAALAVAAALVLARAPARPGRIALAGLGLVLVGATFARNRDYRDAVTLWTDTVAKAPANARAHAALGAALLERDRLPGAIAALTRALQLDPRLAEAHNNLAGALVDAGRPDDAIRHYQAALELRPGIPSTHYNFGRALLGLGRVSEAVAQQEQALLARPRFPEARCALAEALQAAGRLDEAIASYRAALDLQPGLVPASFGLAGALVQAGRGAEAVPHYTDTVRAAPDAVEARYQFGNLLLALGRPAEAAVELAAAVALRPDFAEAHHNLGNACALSGRPAEAVTHYERALALRPDFTITRESLDRLRRANSAPRAP